MSWSEEAGSSSGEKKYKGVRRRKWGKWVSEIRVPGSRERLWLGSYATPEPAAVAHDMAVLLLHGPRSAGSLNFPDSINVAAAAWAGMSPRSVQRVASDSGMAIDAERAIQQSEEERAKGHRREAAIWSEGEYKMFHEESELGVGDYSIDDMEISNNSF